MTSLPVNDIGIIAPVVNEQGTPVPRGTNGQDFMGSLKSAIETQSTAMNILPASQSSSDTPVAREVSDTRDVAQVDGPTQTGRMDRDNESVRNEVRKETKRDTEKNAADEADTVDPETVEAIGEKAQMIIEEVAEELNVDEADVLAAMENLGLSMTDLLDPANMADLVTEISGNQDTINLLTDENLYQTLNNLQEYVADVSEDLRTELDLSQEALNEVLDQTEALIPRAEVSGHIPEVVPEEAVTRNMEVTNAAPETYQVTAHEDGQTVTMDVEVDGSTGVASVTAVETQGNEPDPGNPSESNPGRERHTQTHTENAEITQTVQLNNDINNSISFDNAVNEATTYRTDAGDIANQIMERMRASFKEDITELEMSLHPASLGNVRVNLVSQNGQITAQFMAQNESVRAAIESQVVQLRESLENQGVKIEAVEVTVASHEFDRGSDTAGQHQDEAAREEAKGRLSRTRRIDLSSIEDVSELEDMDEADRIAAQMMAEAGNTVDYTA